MGMYWSTSTQVPGRTFSTNTKVSVRLCHLVSSVCSGSTIQPGTKQSVCFSDRISAELKTPTSFLTVRSSFWRVSASKTQEQSGLVLLCVTTSLAVRPLKTTRTGLRDIVGPLLCPHLPWLLPWILSPVWKQQLSAAPTLRCVSRLHLPCTHAP